MIERLLHSPDPAIRRLAGDESADPLESPRVRTLLDFPDAHPYKKWWGTHWRLTALADLGVPAGAPGLASGVEMELAWLNSPNRKVPTINGLFRRCASQEGNCVYACSKLGFSRDPRVGRLVALLLKWQWPDGGWNCDMKASGRRSSFHETVTPALGLAAYHHATGDSDALAGAIRSAKLLLEHRLFRRLSTGNTIHPAWIVPHYPAYWHYDILQGLNLLAVLGLLGDPRAEDALNALEKCRRADQRFSGASWESAKQRDAVDWGRGPENDMLNLRAEAILLAAGRL